MKYNWILLFIEMFVVLKLLDLLSREIRSKPGWRCFFPGFSRGFS
ncbi:hypothetical protein [Galactobacillus timonensis]|nr:hypothetical protein [Galactobacillus timonensis]